MRTKAAGAAAILANPSHGGLVKVSVYDAAGANPVDLSALALSADPVLEVSITEAVDQSRTATVVLQRQQGARSLAPLVTAGNPLGGTVVDVGRRIVITCAVVPPDSESFYEAPTIFDGYVDEVAWPDDTLTLTCTDKTAKLRDTWIKVERAYGFATGASATKGTLVWAANAVVAVNDLVVPSQSLGNGHFYKVTAGSGSVGSTEPTWPTGSGSTVALGGITYTEVGAVNETGTAVETIIQQVLNDNGLGSLVTLQTPVSPSWLIRPYIQQRQSVADAVQGLVNQLGWRCRFEWSSGLGKYELTLRQPNRAATTADKVLLPQEELRTTSLGIDVYSIRNVVRVAYSDTAARGSNGVVPRKYVEVSDAASIAKYGGERYCEISEDSASQIDSSTEGSRMAQAILDDLKEPGLPMGVVFPIDPYLEINDMVQLSADNLRFSAAQTLAVDSLTHRFSQGDATTEVHLRGKPASNRAGWLELEGRAKPEGVLPTSALDTVSATVSTSSSVVGGVCITLTYSLMKGASPPLVEVHISASGGFTPDATTLKASGQQTSFTIAQLIPGKTYYGRIVPVLTDASGATRRGSPGAEFNFVAGQALAAHLDSSATGPTGLVPNPMLVSAASGVGGSDPPDGWQALAKGAEPAESWGSGGSVWYIENLPTFPRDYVLKLVGSATVRGRVRSQIFQLSPESARYRLSLVATCGASAGQGMVITVETSYDYKLSNGVTTTTFTVPSGTSGARVEFELAVDGSGPFCRIAVEKETISNAYTANFKGLSLDRIASGWTAFNAAGGAAPAFGTGWQNYDASTYNAAGFCKSPDGFVHLRGLVTTTALPDATHRTTAIATLPAGHRPAKINIFPIRTNLSPVTFGTLIVDTGGVIKLDGYTAAQPEGAVGLDGITFDTR